MHAVNGILKSFFPGLVGFQMKEVAVHIILCPRENKKTKEEKEYAIKRSNVCAGEAPIEEACGIQKENNKGHGYVRMGQLLKNVVVEQTLGAFVLRANNGFHKN